MAFKRSQPGLRFSGEKISPDEMDMVRQYVVMNPSTNGSWHGTVAGTSTTTQAFTLLRIKPDYPRNLVASVIHSSGSTAGGTVTVNGKDQFGQVIQEVITTGTGDAGNTAAGTKIFAEVTSATVSFNTMSPTAATAKLGLATGTAAGQEYYFGLPDRIAGTSDVKNIVWLDGTVSTALQGGTINATVVGTALSTFRGTAVINADDSYIVRYRPTFVAEQIQQEL